MLTPTMDWTGLWGLAILTKKYIFIYQEDVDFIHDYGLCSKSLFNAKDRPCKQNRVVFVCVSISYLINDRVVFMIIYPGICLGKVLKKIVG